MAERPRNCIFCERRAKLTREHIWADWLKAYIPKDMPKHSRAKAIVHQDRTDHSVKYVSGDPRSRRVRCVCGPCNNVWMSALQERAKPVLLPLLRGDATVLDLGAQHTLAAWIAMAVIVAEFDDPNHVTSSKDDRDWLYRTGLCPPNWRIWIGNYVRGGDWQPHYVHYVLPIAEKHVPGASFNYPDLPYNTQTTTYVVGQTLVHVMSSTPRNRDIIDRWRFPIGVTAKLAQIAPSVSKIIGWPGGTLNDADADVISTGFLRHVLKITGGGGGFVP